MTLSNAAPFIAARDFLFRQREDYTTAYRDFQWPKLDRFNWALDYFDVMARDNARPALWLVDEDAGETKLTFAQLSERSNRVANWLRRLGRAARRPRAAHARQRRRRCGRCMLAAMKLGAVDHPGDDAADAATISPTGSRAAGSATSSPAPTSPRNSPSCPDDCTRIAVGARRAGLALATRTATRRPAQFTPDGVTGADDPLLLYFTSGTTAKPKLVLHSHRAIRSATCRRCTGSACSRATCT